MRKTFCDRCKKEMHIQGVPKFRVQECDNNFFTTEFVAEYTYDLCAECQLKLKHWLEEKEDSNG